MTLHIEKNSSKDDRFLVRHYAREKIVYNIFKVLKEKILFN